MGQQIYGLLYGCKTEFDWDNVAGSGPSTLSRYPGARPYWEYGEDFCLLGYWIAAGGSGSANLPYLCSFPLARPYELYGDQIDKAKEHWEAFAAWCAEQGLELGEPELYLMETETS